MRVVTTTLMLIARICIAMIFIFAASGKILFYDQTAMYMASKGLTAIPVLLVGAVIVELLGGLSLVFGFKTRFGALILLLFLIPTTLIFHDFWNDSGAERATNQIMFLKNLAIFGGLLYVFCLGGGRCSIDACCHKKQEPKDN